jgi:hypothetical protein
MTGTSNGNQGQKECEKTQEGAKKPVTKEEVGK